MDRGAWQATVHGVARVGHDLVTNPPPRHVFSWLDSSFLFHAESYSIVWMCRGLFIHSSTEGCLGCFYIWRIMNTISLNTCVQVFWTCLQLFG